MLQNLSVLQALTFVIFVGTVGTASADVSDEVVRMWIAAALDGSPAPTDADAQRSLAKTPRDVSATFSSWKKLKECRDDGKSLDLELASAEHYLFIRSFAAAKGDRDIEELPSLYGDVKDKLGPAARLLKTSTQPVSPPDPAVIAWGDRGVAAGLADFTALMGKQPTPKSGDLNHYKLALEGYYENYEETVKNPSCKVSP
jgi:hypothetical protein